MPLDPIALSDVLTARAGESDLRSIVFRLHIRYENLAGATLDEKILSLIQYCDDRQRLDDLSVAVLHVRPDLRVALSPAAFRPSAPAASPMPSPAAPDASAPPFDVFLAHNSQDKPQVEQLAALLRARGMRPWLDSEQIPPGRLWQEVLRTALAQALTAAVILGSAGPGRWQALEIPALVNLCVQQRKPVIPVLLPGVSAIPDTLLFLQQLHHVRFQHQLDEAVALDQLIWGITGQHPASPGTP
jgi:nucleotide-binding universal stress UspA family protein